MRHFQSLKGLLHHTQLLNSIVCKTKKMRTINRDGPWSKLCMILPILSSILIKRLRPNSGMMSNMCLPEMWWTLLQGREIIILKLKHTRPNNDLQCFSMKTVLQHFHNWRLERQVIWFSCCPTPQAWDLFYQTIIRWKPSLTPEYSKSMTQSQTSTLTCRFAINWRVPLDLVIK